MDVQNVEHFYGKAKDYWSKVSPTVDGVLGGFGYISHCDIKGSKAFLKSLFSLPAPPGRERALDCGAGIGRISINLLSKYFDKVDLVEINQSFLDKAKEGLEPSSKLGNQYCCGLQEFTPEPNKYDIIWCQWVLGHLTDDHLVSFLMKCREGLTSRGLIVIKENVASGLIEDKDDVDSSVTRPYKSFINIFARSKLDVIRMTNQTNFPQGLYPVKMFALR